MMQLMRCETFYSPNTDPLKKANAQSTEFDIYLKIGGASQKEQMEIFASWHKKTFENSTESNLQEIFGRQWKKLWDETEDHKKHLPC